MLILHGNNIDCCGRLIRLCVAASPLAQVLQEQQLFLTWPLKQCSLCCDVLLSTGSTVALVKIGSQAGIPKSIHDVDQPMHMYVYIWPVWYA